MRRLLLTAVAAATLAVGPGAALALAHSGAHHHKAHVRRHTRTERFGGIAVAADGSTGATGVTGPTGPTGSTGAPGSQLPPPETAGTVASFTNGVLTIKLNDGTLVSGTITDATQLGCQSMAGGQEDGNGDGSNSQSSGDGGGNQGSGDGGGSGGGGGSSGGGHGDDEGNGNVACTLAAVTPGTVVAEAELRISSSGSVWESLLLVA